MHLIKNGLFFLVCWPESTLFPAPRIFAASKSGQPAKPAFDEKALADFYRGKTVRIVVGFSAGGGYDQYSRLIARHLSPVTSPASQTSWSTTWPAPAA